VIDTNPTRKRGDRPNRKEFPRLRVGLVFCSRPNVSIYAALSISRSEQAQTLKGIEREYASMRLAADRLLEQAGHDVTILRGTHEVRDIRAAADHLEVTNVMRLFAEFEKSLRSFWITEKETEPPMKDLLNGVASRSLVPADLLQEAHAIRDYRNALVHDGHDTHPFTIAEVRRCLCIFLSYLPPSW
jgi:hypothetical protein